MLFFGLYALKIINHNMLLIFCNCIILWAFAFAMLFPLFTLVLPFRLDELFIWRMSDI